MAAVFSNTTKLMLKNVIRHTNSHNKTVEETEMWQQYERMKELGGLDPSNPSYGHDDRCNVRSDRDRRRNDYWNSRSEKRTYLSTSSRSRRAHMDEEEEKGKGGASTSTYWMRHLEKLESSDPNRWDHSGYRELYPEDFRSDRSDSDSPRFGSRHHRRDRKFQKKKKHRSRSKKRKWEERSVSQRHRKQTRRRKHPSPDNSFSSQSSPSPQRKRQPPSRGQRFDKTKSDRYTLPYSSSSSSYSDSDSGAESRVRDQYRKQNQIKTQQLSVSKRRHGKNGKSHRYASSESSSSSSSSDSDSDTDRASRSRFQSQKLRQRKRTRESSVSSHSTGSSDSVSSPHRKKAKTGQSGLRKRTPSRTHSKHKRHKNGNVGHRKRVNREEQDDQLVIKMWKDVNGQTGSSNGDFDRRLQKEISSQYRSLKHQYAQKGRNPKSEVNGMPLVKSEKRQRYSPSSYSSDSD